MGQTILVVDDALEIRALLRAYLEARGCRVLEASDGGEAFAVARSERPDLVIMDIEMPRIEGAPATLVFQDSPATAAIPILIYTGNEEHRVGRKLTFGPKLRYLSKTTDLDRLWRLAQEMMSSAGAR